MNILYATLHEIKKEKGDKEIAFRFRKDNFDVNDNSVQILVSSTALSLNSIKTKKIYCSFNGGNNFEKYFNVLLNKKDACTFKYLSRKTLRYLNKEMTSNTKYTNSTGGYVLFFMYQDDSNAKKYFVCVVFKQNSGISIDQNLNLQDAIYVDLKKLQQAFIINIDMYQSFLMNNKSEKYDSYISFLSQTNNYSSYFIDAFGCDTSSKPEKVTENIIQGVYDYFTKKGVELNSLELKKLALTAKKKVINFLKRKNSELSLYGIRDEIKLCLNSEEEMFSEVNLEIDEFCDGIISHLHNAETYKIPFYFSINKSILKKHLGSKIEDESKRWTLNTEYGIVGKTNENNKTIILNQEERTILIKDVGSKVIEKFIKEMEKQNNDPDYS